MTEALPICLAVMHIDIIIIPMMKHVYFGLCLHTVDTVFGTSALNIP